LIECEKINVKNCSGLESGSNEGGETRYNSDCHGTVTKKSKGEDGKKLLELTRYDQETQERTRDGLPGIVHDRGLKKKSTLDEGMYIFYLGGLAVIKLKGEKNQRPECELLYLQHGAAEKRAAGRRSLQCPYQRQRDYRARVQ
jgi:hypothetical protein